MTRELTSKFCVVSCMHASMIDTANDEHKYHRVQINNVRPVTGLDDIDKNVINQIISLSYTDG